MRFIKIEEYASTEKVLVNVQHISSIKSLPSSESIGYQRIIHINLSDGNSVPTKFTDVESAIDYIQRAPSVSMGAA